MDGQQRLKASTTTTKNQLFPIKEFLGKTLKLLQLACDSTVEQV